MLCISRWLHSQPDSKYSTNNCNAQTIVLCVGVRTPFSVFGEIFFISEKLFEGKELSLSKKKTATLDLKKP